jgi:hypothetical protein
LNTIHDNTWVAHEFGHALTPRQYSDRPADWCVGPSLDGTPVAPCPLPTGRTSYHDFADSWAHHFENTNCWSGWHGKNEGGVNASLNCAANHSEGGWLPRLSEVTVPFNPADPRDHFPEHVCSRPAATPCAADRRRRLVVSAPGHAQQVPINRHPQYFVRFVGRCAAPAGWARPTAMTGTCIADCSTSIKLADQWATSGRGWATGVAQRRAQHQQGNVRFAPPEYSCCRPSVSTGMPPPPMPLIVRRQALPTRLWISMTANGDDVTIDGVVHRSATSCGAGPAPAFVWTGPRYLQWQLRRVSAALCNAECRVEVANATHLASISRTAAGRQSISTRSESVLWAVDTAGAGLGTLDDGGAQLSRVDARRRGGMSASPRTQT